MSRMSDIMEMVKQGYSVKEIKEVFELGKETESEETPEEKTDPPAGEPEQDPGADPEPAEPTNDPEPDYKKLYENTLEQLKKAQETNIRGNAADPNEKTLEEQVQEILGGFIGG